MEPETPQLTKEEIKKKGPVCPFLSTPETLVFCIGSACGFQSKCGVKAKRRP